MFGLGKKKDEQSKVWMIKNTETGLYLGVSKDKLVNLKNPTACFRFPDMDAANVFLHWLCQSKQIKLGMYQTAYSYLVRRADK